MIGHKTVSLADQVFEQLEADILGGKYQRGDIITESQLSRELGVSRTPIREALRKLEQEHIIEESGKGLVVIGISEKDVEDIFAVRRKIEVLAIGLATENFDAEQIEKLNETLELQEFYLEKGNSIQIKKMDNLFHYIIYKQSGSNVFYDILVPLHKKIQKYRRIAVQSADRATESVKEHRKIYEAIVSKNRTLAEKYALEHIENAYRHIKKG